MLPEWLNVLLLGIVEGLTEFLPISSTGHLIIAEAKLGYRDEVFNTVVQTGAVLAVLLVFWKRLQQLLLRWKEREARDYLLKLLVAFLITGVGGVVMKKFGFKLEKDAVPVAWATLIGGVLIIAIELWLKGRSLADHVSWGVAIAVGVGQLVAMGLPGTSRSGATILAALALGVSRPQATEFSFLVGIPTLFSAAGYQVYLAHKEGVEIEWGLVAVGAVGAAVTAFLAVKWFLRYIQTHTFTVFGYYRILVGAVILLLALHWHWIR